MKKTISIFIFFIPTLLFAMDNNVNPSPGVTRVIQTYDTTYSPEACLSNPNIRVQQVCRKMREAMEAQAAKQAEAAQQANGQNASTATPSLSPPAPAWQQALEHKTPVATQDVNENSE